ncbi:pseudouridine synthase [Rhodocollybia butyracea]|uniref:21S rRNA pseudouridine(2819) synthase n=1 Tax=Rhodocollybia butyracea TaxID=206335 RepID=A0A9P5UCS2_9AGAR|nr:pseudouridine synthase [Rhodocollybia butyracea]
MSAHCGSASSSGFMNFRIVFRNSTTLELNRILYIDRAFVVVNKPANFVTQYPKDGQTEAVAELEGTIPSAPSLTKLYPVHRLDKGTTGCLVFARSLAHAQAFSQQFHQRTVQKIYHALVDTSSSRSLATGVTSGVIRVGMALKNGRPYLSRSEAARETSTDWQIIGSNLQAHASLMKLHLHTGMKHQLRVHMSEALQAPIIGDWQHSLSRSSPQKLSIPNDRMFLHASEISFHRFRRAGKHKRLNLTLRAPLPQDFTEFCIRAGIQAPLCLLRGGLFVDGQPVEEVADLAGFWIANAE